MAPFDLDGWMRVHGLPESYRRTVERAARPLVARIEAAARARRPLVVGLCGAQGSGKSTLADLISHRLQAGGRTVATLSLDDLYLPRERRRGLAREVHPLFATRGPPGTHDLALADAVFDALARPGEVALPRFDKAADRHLDRAAWPVVRAPVDVVLFEGWFVGARPQAAADLEAPVNALEREEDVDGRWRRAVNDALAGGYQTLFARIDLLVLLQAPGFEPVSAWRGLQERKLAERLAREGGEGVTMDAAGLARFIAHYERVTRAILAEMPSRADVLIRLGPDHEVADTRGL